MNIQTPPGPAEIEAMLGLDARSRRRRWRGGLLWLLLLLALLAGGAWWVLQAQAAGPGRDL